MLGCPLTLQKGPFWMVCQALSAWTKNSFGCSQALTAVWSQAACLGHHFITTSHLCLVSAAEASWGLLQTSHASQGLVAWCAHQHGALFQGWMGRSGCSPSVGSTWIHSFWTWREFLSINRENGCLEIVLCLNDVGHPLSAQLQLQLHSNSHNSLSSYLSQLHRPPPFVEEGHQWGAF